MIVDISHSNKIMVEKFTVPVTVKTAKAIEKILTTHNGHGVLNQILSNREVPR